MHQELLNITETVEKAGAGLAVTYCAKNLYGLRVGIRRCRSILKHSDNHRSRSFRKTWGGLAAATNDARDWDVFLITAADLLSKAEYRKFERGNREQIQTSHAAAVEVFRSTHWQRHLEEWRRFLELSDEKELGAGHLKASLEAALNKARRALALALAADQDHRWHKFRIAVKDVRYVAEAGKDDPAEGEYLAQVATRCRTLQTLLGDWHDTVVQLGLLGELESTPVHDKLSLLVQKRKARFLSDMHDNLAGQPLFR
jgi:CHAD domain-containing protein